jgi:hypothetical protein
MLNGKVKNNLLTLSIHVNWCCSIVKIGLHMNDLSLDMDESMKLNANGFHNQAWFVISIGYPCHKISFCTSLFQPMTSLYVFISDF